MSATTQNLRQRHGIAAYAAAQTEAIRTSERRAMRAAEQEWRADPKPRLAVVRPPRPSRLDRLAAALWRAHDRSLPVWIVLAVLIGAVDGAIAAVYFGWWTP
jgi:hypothetical protein